jgi:hypothetical protein
VAYLLERKGRRAEVTLSAISSQKLENSDCKRHFAKRTRRIHLTAPPAVVEFISVLRRKRVGGEVAPIPTTMDPRMESGGIRSRMRRPTRPPRLFQ